MSLWVHGNLKLDNHCLKVLGILGETTENQEHIQIIYIFFFISGSASMKDNKRGQDFFMKHKGTLENRLPDFLNPILIKLHEKTVINGLEREQIQNMPIEQRNYRLITIVEKRGVKAQQLFYEVLKDVEPFLMEDLES